MKKIAIIYYSLTGNTDYVAKQISKELDVDLIRLVPKKQYPDSGFKKFFWGGKSAIMKEEPTLEQYQFDESKYDYIVFGTPVWASSFAPPIRTFIKDNKKRLNNKKISVFICHSGGGAQKVIDKLKDILNINDFDAELVLIDPSEKMSDDNIMKIKDFCKTISK